MIRSCLSIALALFAAGTGTSVAQVGPAHQRFAPHPYTTALDALANYQSCGDDARAAAFARLETMFRTSEAAARAKGLGPRLEALRRDYQAMLAVSSRMACAGGPAAAFGGARAAVRAFQAWVAAQPPAR